MPAQSKLYVAPFGPGGSNAVDSTVAERLLSTALAKGGDYATLFFEYRAGGVFVFDEGILKSASRGVSMGLGVRVQRGDAPGCAYVEDVSGEAMKRAAETASQIATRGTGSQPVKLRDVVAPVRYELPAPSIDTPGEAKRALLERASKAAHAYDTSIIKAEASFAEEIREILLATSDRKMVHDAQPLFRFGVRAIAERNGKRQEGSSGGGGRMTL